MCYWSYGNVQMLREGLVLHILLMNKWNNFLYFWSPGLAGLMCGGREETRRGLFVQQFYTKTVLGQIFTWYKSAQFRWPSGANPIYTSWWFALVILSISPGEREEVMKCVQNNLNCTNIWITNFSESILKVVYFLLWLHLSSKTTTQLYFGTRPQCYKG